MPRKNNGWNANGTAPGAEIKILGQNRLSWENYRESYAEMMKAWVAIFHDYEDAKKFPVALLLLSGIYTQPAAWIARSLLAQKKTRENQANQIQHYHKIVMSIYGSASWGGTQHFPELQMQANQGPLQNQRYKQLTLERHKQFVNMIGNYITTHVEPNDPPDWKAGWQRVFYEMNIILAERVLLEFDKKEQEAADAAALNDAMNNSGGAPPPNNNTDPFGNIITTRGRGAKPPPNNNTDPFAPTTAGFGPIKLDATSVITIMIAAGLGVGYAMYTKRKTAGLSGTAAKTLHVKV